MNITMSRQYALILTEEEAKLLRDIMQNPLWGESLEKEDRIVQQLRYYIFNGLKSAMEEK